MHKRVINDSSMAKSQAVGFNIYSQKNKNAQIMKLEAADGIRTHGLLIFRGMSYESAALTGLSHGGLFIANFVIDLSIAIGTCEDLSCNRHTQDLSCDFRSL